MSTLTSLLDGKASSVAEQMHTLGRGAADTIDSARKQTVESLHGAASSIRKGGRQTAKVIESVAETTANKLEGAGSRIEKRYLKRAICQSRLFVRRYPVQSLVLAAVVGSLAGIVIRRD